MNQNVVQVSNSMRWRKRKKKKIAVTHLVILFWIRRRNSCVVEIHLVILFCVVPGFVLEIPNFLSMKVNACLVRISGSCVGLSPRLSLVGSSGVGLCSCCSFY